MILKRPELGEAERLESFISVEPENYLANVCRGVAFWLRGNFEQALIELEQSIVLEPDQEDAYFWVGMACASLGREEEAIGAIKHALEEGLPPVLLAPLRWLEQDRPDFYEKYAKELLAAHNI